MSMSCAIMKLVTPCGGIQASPRFRHLTNHEMARILERVRFAVTRRSHHLASFALRL